MPVKRKARGAGQERRVEILAAAKALFIAEGFSRVTTRALAAKVGLSQTGLYVYFRTKEDILRAIHDETHDALRAHFDHAVAAATSPRDCLHRLIRTYIDFGLAHPADYQLTFTVGPDSLAPLDKDFSKPFHDQEQAARTFLRFRDHLAALASQDLLGGLDPMLVTQMLWFVGHGVVSLLISRPYFPWVDQHELIDRLERVLMAGLAAQSAEPG